MIEFSNEQITLKVTPHVETCGDYGFRSQIIAGLPADIPRREVTVYILYYPCCVSCSSGTYKIGDGAETSIDEMSVSQFLELPGQVVHIWSEQVFKLNPHLIDFVPADEKKS